MQKLFPLDPLQPCQFPSCLSVPLFLLISSLSFLLAFLETRNYSLHKTIYTLCISYMWEFILYCLIYFLRFYLLQGYFSPFVSNSSIVKQTNKINFFCNLHLARVHLLPLYFTQHTQPVNMIAHQPPISRGSRYILENNPSGTLPHIIHPGTNPGKLLSYVKVPFSLLSSLAIAPSWML